MTTPESDPLRDAVRDALEGIAGRPLPETSSWYEVEVMHQHVRPGEWFPDTGRHKSLGGARERATQVYRNFGGPARIVRVTAEVVEEIPGPEVSDDE